MNINFLLILSAQMWPPLTLLVLYLSFLKWIRTFVRNFFSLIFIYDKMITCKPTYSFNFSGMCVMQNFGIIYTLWRICSSTEGQRRLLGTDLEQGLGRRQFCLVRFLFWLWIMNTLILTNLACMWLNREEYAEETSGQKKLDFEIGLCRTEIK